MTHYFYDEIAAKLIAYDEETNTARQLMSVALDTSGTADPTPLTDAKLFPSKKNKAVAKPRKGSSGGKGCKECGSPSRHKKECSRASASKNGTRVLPADDKREDAMSRMTFGRVKMANSHAIESEAIAKNLGVSEDEVVRAIEADTYDDYASL